MADNYTQMTVSPCIPKRFVTEKEMDLLHDEGLSHEELTEEGNKKYYFYCQDGCGENENIVEIFQAIIKRSKGKLKYVVIEGAYTCSKIRPGEFGGFACLITKDKDEWFDTGSWLQRQIAKLK